MLNIKKRNFLFLTILVVIFGLVSCTTGTSNVRIKFEQDEYVVRMQDYLTVKPEVTHDGSVSEVELVYESSKESVVRYEHGVLYPQSEGEATIKVYWRDKEVVFDKAVVKVIKAAL
ncbi:MAG: hypothetical protein ACI32E_01385, partial [Bacilli bacterium]